MTKKRTKSTGNVQTAEHQQEKPAWVLPAKLEGGKFTGKQKEAIDVYERQSEQRRQIALLLYELAGKTGRRELTANEVRTLVRANGKRIPSAADQDRYRLFRWHAARLIEDGFLEPAPKPARGKAVRP
jgi:hypothetical protein